MDEKKPFALDAVDDDNLEGVSGGTEEEPKVITKEDFFRVYGPFMNRGPSSSKGNTDSSEDGYKHYHNKHGH